MSEYAWVWAMGGFILAAIGFVTGWITRVLKGEAAAEAAKAAHDKVEALKDALNAFEADANAKFATIEMVQRSEDRIGAALERLADRIDRFFEMTGPSPRPRAPRKPG